MGYGAGTFGQTTRSFAAVVALAAAAAGGCELVLGDLPPVQATSGTGGAAASSASASSSTSSRASSSTGSVGTGGTACCDCDGDHFEAEGMCGGKDCDDHDARVYPGETVYYATASKNPAVGFDYDCSGMPDPNPALNTTVNCGLIGLPCTGQSGYLQQVPPPCGEGAPWGGCKQQGLGCVNDVTDQNRVMTCK